MMTTSRTPMSTIIFVLVLLFIACAEIASQNTTASNVSQGATSGVCLPPPFGCPSSPPPTPPPFFQSLARINVNLYPDTISTSGDWANAHTVIDGVKMLRLNITINPGDSQIKNYADIVEIDTTKKVEFLATKASDAHKGTDAGAPLTRDFLTNLNKSGVPALLAINAYSFGARWPGSVPSLLVSEGTLGTKCPLNRTCPSFVVKQDGTPALISAIKDGDDLSSFRIAIGSFPGAGLILTNGVVSIGAGDINPRTAIGISQDGKKVYLFTVSGRKYDGYSVGMQLREVARTLHAFGAYNAINMDGGGSTTMAWWADGRATESTITGDNRTIAVNLAVVDTRNTILAVNPSSIQWNSGQSEQNITVDARNGTGTVSVTQSAASSWLTVRDRGAGTYTLSATEHTGTTDRNATVTFAYAGKTVQVSVVQKAVILTVSPSSIQWNSGQNEQNITVNARNGTGTVSVTQSAASSWLTVSNRSAGTYTLSATEHTGTTDRSATVTFAYGGKTVQVSVVQKQKMVQTFGGVTPQNMIIVGKAGVTYSVPTRSGTESVAGGFLIGSTEVTYEEWVDVRKWAESVGYTFRNKGMEGSSGRPGSDPTTSGSTKPVTNVTWQDVIVWTNAKSQKENLEPVYVSATGVTLRNAHETAVNSAVRKNGANGYRLPTSGEWDMAARWLGTTAPTKGSLANNRQTTSVNGTTHYWTPSDFASGATERSDKKNHGELASVSWYQDNSRNEGARPVRQKRANALGAYDMNGNVEEMTFTTWKCLRNTSCSRTRGGKYWSSFPTIDEQSALMFGSTSNSTGFRLAL